MIYRYCLFIFCTGLYSCQQSTSPSPEKLERITYTSSFDNSERDYYLYIPKGYDPEDTVQWPVLLFLHGNGERGNGKDELKISMAHGPIYEVWVQKRDLPFFIIGPQLHMHGFDTMGISYLTNRKVEDYPDRLAVGVPARNAKFQNTEQMNGIPSDSNFPVEGTGLPRGWDTVDQDLLGMIDHVLENFKTDAARVYLSGLSYGGFGTWHMASKYPERFAAIAPVVGWGHPDLMAPLVQHNIPIWCFAGGRDAAVRIQYFYPGMNKLEELGHDNFRFTIEADMNHDVWTRVYSGDDIYNWLLQFKK